MKITYKEAKQRASKERDIWVRKLVCDPLTTPLAYLCARYGIMNPKGVTYLTFATGMVAALLFWIGALTAGSVFYAGCFLLDSLDGKLSRVLDQDDTYRGMLDFLLDGIVCLAVTIALAWHGDPILTFLLLVFMSIHYLGMRYTSATYRLKVQTGDSDLWMINKETKGVLGLYTKFVHKFKTYPHPTLGDGIVLMFVVGPQLWYWLDIKYMHVSVVLAILFMVPETIGAGLIAYKKADELK